MPAVDEIEEGMSGGGLVVPLPHLPRPTSSSEQVGLRPGLEAQGVGIVG